MKGKTRITLNRETLKELLEAHLASTMLFEHEITEWTVHRNGAVDVVIQAKKQPAPEAEPAPEL